MEKICIGYYYPGEVSWLRNPCPELSRQSGHKPEIFGGKPGYGYPENWDKECPTCNNSGYMNHNQEPAYVGTPKAPRYSYL